MGSTGVQKQLGKLETQLASGNFYEAHEMFKTVFQRHRARGHQEDSYALAEEGAKLQLMQGQLNCGVELALMLVEAYEADGQPPTPEALARLSAVLDAFPMRHLGDEAGEAEPPVEPYSRVIASAVKWARRNNDMEAAVALESKLAGYMTACLGWQGLGIAMRHFIRAGDTSGLAAALVEAAQHAGPNEEDLLLVRAVLCTAASSSSGGGGGATGQVAAARELLEAYASAAGHQPPATPLLRFTQLLLEALRERKGELIDLLMQRYAPSLDRDPMLVQLVEQAKWAALGGGRAGGGLLDIFSVLNGGAGVSSSPAAVGNSV